jgi:hypothetical protein
MISYSDMMSAIEKMNPSINNTYCNVIDIEKFGVAFNEDIEKLGVVFNEDLKKLREKLGYPKRLGD